MIAMIIVLLISDEVGLLEQLLFMMLEFSDHLDVDVRYERVYCGLGVAE